MPRHFPGSQQFKAAGKSWGKNLAAVIQKRNEYIKAGLADFRKMYPLNYFGPGQYGHPADHNKNKKRIDAQRAKEKAVYDAWAKANPAAAKARKFQVDQSLFSQDASHDLDEKQAEAEGMPKLPKGAAAKQAKPAPAGLKKGDRVAWMVQGPQGHLTLKIGTFPQNTPYHAKKYDPKKLIGAKVAFEMNGSMVTGNIKGTGVSDTTFQVTLDHNKAVLGDVKVANMVFIEPPP